MNKYLEFFPEPLLEDIVKGECLPIIGAGFSRNAFMPEGVVMPDWEGLGEMFEKYLPGYDCKGALDAISAYSHEYSRCSLVSKLSDFLNVNKIKPGETHKSFAELPFKIVCTTNFDFLLEDSYQACCRQYKPVLDESQLSLSSDDKTTLILKIHGDLNHPNELVATEEDYDLFVEKKPLFSTYLSYLLIVKTPLFIGYSIDDPDFRQIFKIVNERLGQTRRPAYAILRDASKYDVEKYERRGVKVINITCGKASYPEIFSELFKGLKLYWEKKVIEGSTFTQKEPVKQLFNNTDSQKRLCYFSIPHTEMPLYKGMVYPLVKKYGFVPLCGDEVISFGDTVMAKISAMIDKSELIIADISGGNLNVLAELSMAIGCKGKKILIIGDDINKAPYFLQDQQIVRKDANLNFVKEIDLWLKKVSEILYENFFDEPDRLLKIKDYRSAVISAYSLLEMEVDKCCGRNDYDDENRENTPSDLVKKAMENMLLYSNQIVQLKKWQNVRNRLAYTNATIEKHEAEEIVKGIIDFIRDIRNAYGR